MLQTYEMNEELTGCKSKSMLFFSASGGYPFPHPSPARCRPNMPQT